MRFMLSYFIGYYFNFKFLGGIVRITYKITPKLIFKRFPQ